MGRPSTGTFIAALKSSGLMNCPVTLGDVEAAEQIFGPDIGSLKGKTTQRNPPIIDSPITPVLAEVLKRYRKVTICIDIMYMNRIPMLVSISRNIKFGTIEATPNNKTATVLKGVKAILQLYQGNGVTIEMALMDGEFGHLRGELAGMGVTLNERSQDEHVGGHQKIHPNGQRVYVGNLQHLAIQQDSGTTGHRDGQSEHFLAEWDATERQLWKRTESPSHRHRTEVGLQ